MEYRIHGDTLTDIADAIREKKGTEEPISVSDFSSEILSIPSGSQNLGFIFTNGDSYTVLTDCSNFYGIELCYMTPYLVDNYAHVVGAGWSDDFLVRNEQSSAPGVTNIKVKGTSYNVTPKTDKPNILVVKNGDVVFNDVVIGHHDTNSPLVNTTNRNFYISANSGNGQHGYNMIFYVKLYNKDGELIADVFAKQKENMYGAGGLYDNVRGDYINPNVDERFINRYIYGEMPI